MKHGLRMFVLMSCVCAASQMTGCSIQRAQTASSAQTAMIGMSKEAVLACMGVPQTKAAEGNVEVWGYQSGNGRIDNYSNAYSSTTGSALASAAGTRVGNTTYAVGSAAGNSQTNSFGYGSTRQRSCTVSVVMANGIVSRVNYSGPTGGVLTKGEQCAYAVENCLK